MNKIVTLGEIAEIKTGPFGTQFKASEYTKQGIPVINVKNIGYGNIVKSDLDFVNETTVERLSEHVLQKDDIVFGRKGSVDRHCIIRENETGWLQGSDCIRVRIVNKAVNPLFVSYYLSLRCIKDQLSNSAVGSTMPSMNSQIIKNIAIKCPEKELQDKIAELLETINKKIEINRDIVMELDNAVKEIYDHWFLQYDFPDENGKPYKSSGGEMVWNEELKREIPVGWEVSDLSYLCDITMGSSPQGESFNELGEGDIFYQGKTDFGQRFPNVRLYTTAPVRLAQEGDVLLSVRAPVGDINIASGRCCIGRGLAALHSEYKSFLYYTMLCNQYQFNKYNNSGTTFGAITKDALYTIKVVIPHPKLVSLFEKRVGKYDEKILKSFKENEEFISLRNFLLPLLMNGQVGFK